MNTSPLSLPSSYFSNIPQQSRNSSDEPISTVASNLIGGINEKIVRDNPILCCCIYGKTCSPTPVKVLSSACCIGQASLCLGLPKLYATAYACLPFVIIPGWCYKDRST